jgi:glycosyltransferase involved in cell wall biosynthesis
MHESKNVLFVIDHFGSGGAQRQVVNLANGLSNKGFKVHIVVYYPQYDHHRYALRSEVVVHELSKRTKLGITVPFNILYLLYKYRYKAVFGFLDTPGLYLELASLLYFHKTALCYSERSSLALQKKGPGYFIKQNLHKLCDFITSNSIAQTEALAAKFGSKKVRYIANAVPKVFHDVVKNSTTYSEKVFAVFSHTTPFKNFSYVVDSLIDYKVRFKSDPPIINWYGHIYESSELNIAREKLLLHGLQDSLIFHGPVSNVETILSKVFFLLHPSRFESSANAVAEALSTGTPVILGNINDHPIIVKESCSGFLVDLSNPSSLANSLNVALNISEEEYGNLCRNAKLYSSYNYADEVAVCKYLDIINNGC